MSEKSEKAKQLFKSGYNCSQSVLCAFCDEINLDFDTALMLSSSFGGGMGRLREVCGAVSSIFMVAGLLYGYTSPTDKEAKALHYQLIQNLAEKFKEENHSIICRELLGLTTKSDSPIPSDRTEVYYKTRPCVELVGCAAEIIENLIKEKSR
ncbi:MAG: C-GCAxxG-C-C family protein [Clostridia bacterium]